MDASLLGYLAAALGAVVTAAGGALVDATVQDAYQKVKSLLRVRYKISETEVVEFVDNSGRLTPASADKWDQAISDQEVLLAFQSLILSMERHHQDGHESAFAVLVSNSVAKNILISKITGGGVRVDHSSAAEDIAVSKVKIEKHAS